MKYMMLVYLDEQAMTEEERAHCYVESAQLTQDLTLQFNVKGGGLGLKTADVVVPEPSTLALVGIGAMGLLARRRKRS